jgi:hypothetical protein
MTTIRVLSEYCFRVERRINNTIKLAIGLDQTGEIDNGGVTNDERIGTPIVLRVIVAALLDGKAIIIVVTHDDASRKKVRTMLKRMVRTHDLFRSIYYRDIVSCPLNKRYIAGGQLAVFQGAREAPKS